MSSDPNKTQLNNTQTRRMGSIQRRLSAAWAGKHLGRIFLEGIVLLILAVAAYIGIREYAAFGRVSFRTDRTLEKLREADGTLEVIYRAVEKQSGTEVPAEVSFPLREVVLFCLIVIGSICLLRLIWMLCVSLPAQNRRTREILAPLNELALKADELSRLEFGEDKYQLIEDAISHLDAGEGAKLSLQDSELMGIEAAINNLLTRIRESNRQQARFVNDASHELRTPIAVISGYADMLARWGKDDEKVLNESIAAIRTEAARMKHLVEQLLFLARGDSGKTQLQREAVSPEALMQEAYEESVMIDEKHIYRLRNDAAGVTVQADPGLLKQAVRILIDNAAKYTNEGDEIVLSTGRADGHVFLQVQDSGIGMAQADVVHMFERFYRADEARSFEGTGLGLSIAKWIVDKHGGHFEILSREEIGTRIRIVL